MNTYINVKAYVDYYADPVSLTPLGNFGTATYVFRGDGGETNGRLKVTEINLNKDVWVAQKDLRLLTPDEVKPDFPPLKETEFYESCVSSANVVNNLPGIGSMNSEYLLLLAWIESKWTNSDAQGKQGADADLSGPVGPFRFASDTWKTILTNDDLRDVTIGFDDYDRFRPNVQPLFAGAYATSLQSALRSELGLIDPAAWLLSVGHRVGADQLIRFIQLDYGSSINQKIGGSPAIDQATVNQHPNLFPSGAQTTKSEIHEITRTEFKAAREEVTARLGSVLDELGLSISTDADSDFRPSILGFLDFIGKYEAAGNYNAIFGKTNNQNHPRLVTMTISQVLQFQSTVSYSACGKYQIIQSTLQGNYSKVGLTENDLFDAAAQDAIASHLLLKVRGGEAFLKSARAHQDFHDFALAVAQEWAALPVLRETAGANRTVQRGQSYYAGVGPNKARVSADLYEAALAKLMRETSD